jgi:hypothetical protein
VGLGQGIAEMRDAVRERVEVSWHHETWHVTAASFEDALAYVRGRFDDPAVLSRTDRGRHWTRTTLEVTTDPARAEAAPPLDELANPPAPAPPAAPPAESVAAPRSHGDDAVQPVESELPEALEAIFASQDNRTYASQLR